MSNAYNVELTDTFAGEANYGWVRRARVTIPELTHYGYSGSTDGSYATANKTARRELMRRAKAAVGYTGVRGVTHVYGDSIEFRPHRMCVVMFVTFADEPEGE